MSSIHTERVFGEFAIEQQIFDKGRFVFGILLIYKMQVAADVVNKKLYLVMVIAMCKNTIAY